MGVPTTLPPALWRWSTPGHRSGEQSKPLVWGGLILHQTGCQHEPAAPPDFSIHDCWGLRGDGAVCMLSPQFTTMRKAGRLVFICMLFNIINSVTLHTTSNNDKYCNGNVKKNIIHVSCF